MKKHLLRITALFALGLVMTACQRDKIESEDSIGSEDIAASQAMMDDADDQASFKSDPTSTLGDEGSATSGNCPTLTWAQPHGTYPNTLTIDYGTGCQCRDGREKSGQIIVETSADMRTSGAVQVITLQDFYVAGTHMEGSRTVTHTGLNGLDQPVYSVTGSGNATFSNGETAALEINHVRTMIAGSETESVDDDVFSIIGTQSAVNRKGKSVTGTIIQPLIRSRQCRWITEGVVEITASGRTRTLDFGDGTCDNEATITFANGSERTIQLRRN